MLLAFLMTDKEAKKYLSRRFKGLVDSWRFNQNPIHISPATFQQENREIEEEIGNNVLNDICVIELD